MAEKHVHKVYGSFPPWGKSVKPANGGGGNYSYIPYFSEGVTREVCDALYQTSTLIKIVVHANDDSDSIITQIEPYAFFSDLIHGQFYPIAFMVDMEAEMLLDSEKVTIKDYVNSFSDGHELETFSREEFYGNSYMICYSAKHGYPVYEYVDGMTWADFCDSEYNRDGFYVSGNSVMIDSEPIMRGDVAVLPNDKILHNVGYDQHYSGGGPI